MYSNYIPGNVFSFHAYRINCNFCFRLQKGAGRRIPSPRRRAARTGTHCRQSCAFPRCRITERMRILSGWQRAIF